MKQPAKHQRHHLKPTQKAVKHKKTSKSASKTTDFRTVEHIEKPQEPVLSKLHFWEY
jgi:hypothetical protein